MQIGLVFQIYILSFTLKRGLEGSGSNTDRIVSFQGKVRLHLMSAHKTKILILKKSENELTVEHTAKFQI